MASSGPEAFDSTEQFEALLDAYVRGFEARIGERA
jgi:hypothetical protein